jgi:hypothetical protein
MVEGKENRKRRFHKKPPFIPDESVYYGIYRTARSERRFAFGIFVRYERTLYEFIGGPGPKAKLRFAFGWGVFAERKLQAYAAGHFVYTLHTGRHGGEAFRLRGPKRGP